MSDGTYKDLFGDGYTTYHDDGSTSRTQKDLFGDGYTTYHSDGSTSRTFKDLFGSGYTSYRSGGSRGASSSGTGGFPFALGGTRPSYGSGSRVGSYSSASMEGDDEEFEFVWVLFYSLCVMFLCYAAYLLLPGFSWVMAAILWVVLVMGMYQRRYRDAARQVVWFRWAWIQTVIVCIHTFLSTLDGNGTASMTIRQSVAILAFLLAMWPIIRYSIGLNGTPTVVSGAFMVVSSMIVILGVFVDATFTLKIYLPILWSILILLIILNFMQSFSDCRLGIVAGLLTMLACLMLGIPVLQLALVALP